MVRKLVYVTLTYAILPAEKYSPEEQYCFNAFYYSRDHHCIITWNVLSRQLLRFRILVIYSSVKIIVIIAG